MGRSALGRTSLSPPILRPCSSSDRQQLRGRPARPKAPELTRRGRCFRSPSLQEALAGFYRETGEAALETEGFFARNHTSLALLHEKYKVRGLRLS
jgi:hypothetical protein